MRRSRVREKTRQAVRAGRLEVPEGCELCGFVIARTELAHLNDRGLTAHHIDYDDPYAVLWVCHSCHNQIHRDAIPGAHRGRYEHLVWDRMHRQ